MEIIDTTSAPGAVGPYSQAISQGGQLYASGQIPLDPATGQLVSEDFEAQARQCLVNLAAVLKAGGSSLGQALKVTVYVTDLRDFPKLNAIYAEFFSQHHPARCCVQVSALPLNAQVEIDAIAIVP
ncbi:MAG: RidA family protein [Dehalococcoidia bacterium]|nr:RidA family protein [Dehalococcoidia bacterium]